MEIPDSTRKSLWIGAGASLIYMGCIWMMFNVDRFQAGMANLKT